MIQILEKQYNSAIKKGWDKLYIAVDIHDTIFFSNYNVDVLPTEFMPYAKETLQYLSTRKDIVMFLYTCSWPAEVEKYQNVFKSFNINFKYCNENPEVENNRLGCYSQKPYYNLILDDKGNFIAEKDWQIIMKFFQSKPILK